ncbi:deaminated glutathione amidase isoform X3 [Ahaetulla prasina]|uniref:deaminated glutathione amidase isoform X3 n=1 Tax=Ahaetulla prasina TaxID=499056 RepID=UPI0026471580|nr:deaminated glutathione amidase isoform X3 [Ahaetulla prasina]
MNVIQIRLRGVVQKTLQILCGAGKQFRCIQSQEPGHSFPAMSSGAGGPKPLIAVCQVTSTPDRENNWAACSQLVREATRRDACVVFLPEAFDFIGSCTEETLSLAEPLEGDYLQRYVSLARECGVWLSLGGFHERGKDWESTQRIYNCHLLVDPKGCVVAAYRKIHLFDVELEGRVSLKESAFTNPGSEMVPPVHTPAGKVGLAICYDLRFPEMSLALAQAGAEILTYPSAFTVTTGAAHWEVLLRARAVETQCYVVAAAQTGQHHPRRTSFGHSMVVDPWGSIVAQCKEGPGLCFAEIDLAYLHRLRQEMPVFAHRQPRLYGRAAAEWGFASP